MADTEYSKELETAAGIVYLSPETAIFSRSGDFLALDTVGDTRSHYPRVSLHRAFPLESPYRYISVLDPDECEIGIIRDVDDFPHECAYMLRTELRRRYYVCDLTSVTSVRDKRGFSYWVAKTGDTEVSFTLRDTFNSIRQAPDGTVLITDIDSNRYTLPSPERLDRRSHRLIESYL